jgi:D-glycero-beta-D-manno-heptose 1-phosphate adenylyltransferase
MILNLHDDHDCTILRRFINETDGQYTVGITSGVFDLYHYMHDIYLERCARKCDYLLVGVDSDALVKQCKGDDRPIVPEHQRVALVANRKSVTAAFIMDSIDDLAKACELFGVTFIFKNDAFVGKDVAGINKQHSYPKLVIIPDIKANNSTTNLIETIITMGRKIGDKIPSDLEPTKPTKRKAQS